MQVKVASTHLTKIWKNFPAAGQIVRWPLLFFFNILDAAANNAYIHINAEKWLQKFSERLPEKADIGLVHTLYTIWWWWWWWWFYPIHSWGWGRGSTPRSPNNRATPHGRDQRSKRERVWPNMARHRGSSTGQSSTRCERSCGSEPQLLHEEVSARPTLWR